MQERTEAEKAAYKKGKHDYCYEEPKKSRKDFNTEGEFQEYRLGWRYYAVEDALDRDTEWD